MINKKLNNNQVSMLYILVVLLSTWIFAFLIFFNPITGLSMISFFMFIPAIVAIIFNLLGRKPIKSMFSCIITKPNLKSMVFGIGYPLLFIAICAVIALITGLGHLDLANLGYSGLDLSDSGFLTVLIIVVILILLNLIPVFGEEYGWRGYLLPRLTKSMGKIWATVIVGVVWALFHFPIVYTLAQITGIGNPLLVATIQACAVFFFSFSFSYSYYLSSNLIPVLFYHSTWNIVNVLILGDIYTKKLGIITGNIVFVSGEGLIGVILGGILAIWFIRQFNKSDKYSNRI